jgi:hypothetical protein
MPSTPSRSATPQLPSVSPQLPPVQLPPVTMPSTPLRSATPQLPPVPQLGTPPQTQAQPLSVSHVAPQTRPRSRSSTGSPSPRPWPIRSPTPQDDCMDMQRSPHASYPHSAIEGPLVPVETPGTPPESLPQSRMLALDTSSWPKHALDAYHYLRNKTTIGENGEKVTTLRGWGDEWSACVDGFMEFQKLAGFPVSQLRLWTK